MADLVKLLRWWGEDGVAGERETLILAADEIESLRRQIKVVQAAFRTFQEAQKPITETYVRNSRINQEAVATLDGERQANAIMTDRIEALETTLRQIADSGNSINAHLAAQVLGDG